jgi:hypothetical protein
MGACLDDLLFFSLDLDLAAASSFCSRASRSFVRMSSTAEDAVSSFVRLSLRFFERIEACALARAPKEMSASEALKSSPSSCSDSGSSSMSELLASDWESASVPSSPSVLESSACWIGC